MTDHRTAKVHWIGSQLPGGWQATACGKLGMRDRRGPSDEYITATNQRFEAKFKNWAGVTCKGCLRNPHAPGNRCSQSATEGKSP